ncbi:MAG: dihydroorotate dehydrogenase (quinone), partial [Pseudomonadota bacterium]
MSLAERTALALFHRIDPERAHNLALTALRLGLAPRPGPVTSSRLRCRVVGRNFPNPVGIAAGFDKNGVAIAPALATGFGFVEVGAVTPRPQPGNPKPRLFRLAEDGAVINRFGFNNAGLQALKSRLEATPHKVGINLGANKDSTDRAADYVAGIRALAPHAAFFTVNISSPNTAGLRDLQESAALSDLLAQTVAARAETAEHPPLLLKIAPDLTKDDLRDIARIAMDH